MKSILKQSLPHLAALLIFFALISVYFYPSIYEGKGIQQSDMQSYYGATEELLKYHEEEGGSSAWTGTLFSGMPAYHIYIYGTPKNYMRYVEKPIKAIDDKAASMILMALLSFYVLMCVMGVRKWLAIAGAIAFAFASYNFIIIGVGHVTKMYVIAYMPLTLTGMILLFRRKWLWGGVTFLLGVYLSLANSHMQITYYLALLCLVVYIGWLINELMKKEYSVLAKATGIMVIGVVLAVLPMAGGLYSNYESAQTSMRGPGELTEPDGKKASGGLDIDYAYEWSYGKGELLTLLIPNAYGGASGETLGKESRFYKEYKRMGAKIGKEVQAPTYWGDQRFTAGPVYFGAIVCFLFVLGLFVIKNPLKWWLTAGALLLILMALGKNLMWFNEFLFYHLPMYNKFRVPSMALVIPGLVFPLIGIWGLKEILNQKIETKKLQKALIWSTGIVGGICLLIWAVPSLFLTFQSANDAMYQMPDSLLDALVADRKSMASSDAFRSLAFILLALALIVFFMKTKNKKLGTTVVGVGIMLLMLLDLWQVDKRYLNDDMFSKQTIAESYQPTPADKVILEDKAPSYRVLNLSRSTFNENQTSFFHKSIGGYSAVKLRRYQELIDHRISLEMQKIAGAFQGAKTMEDIFPIFETTPTLNMLNAKYVIYHADQAPIVNPYAFGNAWFVDRVEIVASADEEIAALNTIDPRTTAVVDARFEDLVDRAFVPDSTATISLLEYKPNYLKYETNASTKQLAVFSEIYYKEGWKAFVDGEQVPHFRTDWTLRGMNVPAGKHTIEFRFEPDKYNQANIISSISSLIILVGFVLILLFSFWKALKKPTLKKED